MTDKEIEAKARSICVNNAKKFDNEDWETVERNFPAQSKALVKEIATALTEASAVPDKVRESLELIAAPRRADGTYNRCREACELLAREALKLLGGEAK